ncbi:MAG: hypothetical protein A3A44_01120 [Candidatus Sungbacteria bacterium RIFCSPLOWO2_01_FULL_60_25]|uniref:methionine--tRNA ligase n=1 Tax=Candidatus Sungbacteria bacterium RIFCSPLOWO2_01_FULL_60_25 TaxID=1802281 RepID=A0A1G2LBI7_9BACT|nr:MAG: hypothetical protein A3A44_01120 [Candidatus Sungbacteria bacterium RIFCSPLOWO2_01_FULL_60_25]
MAFKTQKTFYITTAIPYVNAEPHLGFGLELVQADVVARHRRLIGDDVRFVTGTDENALKNFLAARERGMEPMDLIERNAAAFRELREVLDLSWDDFIRTTEPRHIRGAKKFWQACDPGDIYKRSYRGIYCPGCEEFKTEKDLADGCCPEHPHTKLEAVEEENYFFRLSKYQDAIEDLIASGRLEIIPETRRHEILSFVRQGLQDFSISRSSARSHGFGIPVPGDSSQVQYVWFDALTNYINALGYADDAEPFRRYWRDGDMVLHVIGKGIARFHAVHWPAMLLSAGLPLPKKIFVHGYITVEGQKISKTLGNIIVPKEIAGEYGTDALRYYLLREIPAFEDGDFSEQKLVERYNGDLANGLGNLVARVATLGERVSPIPLVEVSLREDIRAATRETREAVRSATDSFRFNEALADIWRLIGVADRFVNETKPWAIEDEAELRVVLANACAVVVAVADLIEPYLPGTTGRIRAQISLKDGEVIVKRGEGLFPRRA